MRDIVPAPADFYELLGLDLDAGAADVRLAYRSLQRIVHPDIAGESATEMAAFLNVAHATLMDDSVRGLYARDVQRFRREVGQFDGRPVSRWLGAEAEQRAVFVDESTCIGCMNCTNCAPSTFFIEDEYGRARVHAQWGDEEDAIREAVDMCPVDCIAYIKRSQLALLEFVMKSCSREDIAIMARRRSGNLSTAPAKGNPFVRAEVWLKYRSEAQVALDDGVKRMQDEALAAAIARVWLALPDAVREKGWPAWTSKQARAPVAFPASMQP
ncbi:hypothetical protein WJX81_003146 [Elliptochloris bilobata]|uniref:J domain-containing protein n=1 Tax=Elliptochloris bilobata TaxID=381761 RepID=A0AAW1QNG7_9CHLO